MTALADTNVVLAFMLRDRQVERQAAAAWIEKHGTLTVTEVVLAEACWYLLRTRGTQPSAVAAHLRELLESDGFTAWDEHLAFAALRLLESNPGLAFADCLLAARAVVDDDTVLTFDRRLNRVIENL